MNQRKNRRSICALNFTRIARNAEREKQKSELKVPPLSTKQQKLFPEKLEAENKSESTKKIGNLLFLYFFIYFHIFKIFEVGTAEIYTGKWNGIDGCG